jgi:hypothetical protein
VSKASTRSQPGLSVRGDREWVDWVRRAARTQQRSCSSLIDRALREWAWGHGLPDPPPRQGGGESQHLDREPTEVAQ